MVWGVGRRAESGGFKVKGSISQGIRYGVQGLGVHGAG